MTDTDRERARERLEQLHARFSANLRERVAELDGLVRAAQEGSSGANATAAMAPAMTAAHRLAGTAGSYGHPAVGEAAAALERALERIRDAWAAKAAPDAAAWGEAFEALAHAHLAASASAGESGMR